MKTKITILMMAVALFTNAMAQSDNVWYDVDFNSEEWLDAFLEVKLVEDPVKYADFRNISVGAPDNGALNFGSVIPTVKGFTFNANAYREANPFTSLCGRTFEYSIRLKQQSNETYIEFPELVNVGKITLYVQNPNTGSGSSVTNTLRLEKKNGNNWELLETGSIPPLGDLAGSSDFKLTYNPDINEPVTLRVYRAEARFLKVFRIVIEKYDGGTSTQSVFRKTTDLSVTERTLSLGDASNGTLSIFDLAGKQVFNCKVNSNKIDLQNMNAGAYIVKLITEQGEVTRKIILLR